MDSGPPKTNTGSVVGKDIDMLLNNLSKLSSHSLRKGRSALLVCSSVRVRKSQELFFTFTFCFLTYLLTRVT